MNNCPGGCGGTPPFYKEVIREVTENHTTVLSSTVFASGISITDSWNVPGYNESIAVGVVGVLQLPVGEYFHHPQYGYFQITSWNPKKGIVGLTNTRIKGTAAPGTHVSADTLFILADRPCCEDASESLFPYVAEDFVAPVLNAVVTVKVTSTFSLILGSLVRVGTAIYRLVAVSSLKEIVLKNEGSGFTAGELVAAKVDGDYQYLITNAAGAQLTATNGLEIVGFTAIGIANGAVTTAKLAEAAVTNSKLADNSVWGARIAADAITTSKISDSAVTNAKLASGVNGTARTNIALVSQVQDGAFIWCGTSTGTANAQILTPSPAVPNIVSGQYFSFIAGFTNTGVTTVNVSGVGVNSVQRPDGTSLLAGDITAGQQYTIINAGGLRLINPSPKWNTWAGSFLATETGSLGFTIVVNSKFKKDLDGDVHFSFGIDDVQVSGPSYALTLNLPVTANDVYFGSAVRLVQAGVTTIRGAHLSSTTVLRIPILGGLSDGFSIRGSIIYRAA